MYILSFISHGDVDAIIVPIKSLGSLGTGKFSNLPDVTPITAKEAGFETRLPNPTAGVLNLEDNSRLSCLRERTQMPKPM